MVFASFLGAFAEIWMQTVNWSYPRGFYLIFGSICGNLDANCKLVLPPLFLPHFWESICGNLEANSKMDIPPWFLPHFWENLRKFGCKQLIGPVPMVFASFLGAFAEIWMQTVKWSYHHGFA